MPYTVTWDPDALRELADIWNNAPDRQAVADAADEIDRALRTAPLRVGEAAGRVRRFRYEPLEVLYEVSEDDREARVLWVTRVS